MANLVERREFINLLLPDILKVCYERGYNMAVAMTSLSQCALESGWLQSQKMKDNNAPFGIKGSYNGNYYETPTKEYQNGKYITVNAKFRKYPDIYSACCDYFDLLATGRYKNCLNAQSVVECITIIKNCGYATDPNYINSVVAVYDTICNTIRC